MTFEEIAAAISACGFGFDVNNAFDFGKTPHGIFYEALIWPHVGRDAPRWVGCGDTPGKALEMAWRAAEAALKPEMAEEIAA
jgi:hypothetical protein